MRFTNRPIPTTSMIVVSFALAVGIAVVGAALVGSQWTCMDVDAGAGLGLRLSTIFASLLAGMAAEIALFFASRLAAWQQLSVAMATAALVVGVALAVSVGDTNPCM